VAHLAPALAAVTSSAASPLQRRAADLARLVDTPWDLVIVGGGIVGSGILLDAASRGMRAALVEQEDIAAGTSSRSSRLIHGGLRYLEQLHLPLVREALAERRRLLRLAPHLVTLEPLLFPIYGLPLVTKAFYDAGLTLYDVLGARHDGGWHRRLGVEDTLAIAPDLRRDGLRGGLLYHDGMEDDARYTLAVLRSALAADPTDGDVVAVTRVTATGVRRAGGSGAPDGVVARDDLTGTDLVIPARAIVDATGAWAADPAHPFASPSMRILPSRGAHLVVPRERIPASAGLTIRVPGKVVFLVPWPDHWLIGTTDAPYSGPTERPAADGWEVDRLLATVNETLDVGLTRDDVVGTYAGLRPLIAPSGGSTVKASREHRVTTEADGVTRIGGGKYTTYRVMARDVVDAVLGPTEAKARPSGTAEHRLIGAADRPALDRLVAELATIPEVTAAHPEAAARLVRRHGTEASAVVGLGGELGLLRPLVPGRPFLEAEVAWAVRHELALSVDDVL
jgi:glycerol-3-phosphate dehydrogenase